MHIKNEIFIESNVSNDTENRKGKLTEEIKKIFSFLLLFCWKLYDVRQRG